MYAGGARSPGAYAAVCSFVPRRPASHVDPVVCCGEQRRMGSTRGVVAPATGHFGLRVRRSGGQRAHSPEEPVGCVSVTSPSRAVRLEDVQVALLQRALKPLPWRQARVSIHNRRKPVTKNELTCRMSTSADTSAVGFPAAALRQRVLVPGATKRPALSLGREIEPPVHPQRGHYKVVSSLLRVDGRRPSQRVHYRVVSS